jgi:MFS family permease
VTRLTRALKHRNYRLFFGGQTVSLVGTWITRIATSWLVYRLTKSALLLGVVGFAGQIPLLLLGPIGGVVSDRWHRHRLLVWTQALSALQSLALAILAFTHITVVEIILLQVVQGIINAFDTPARQAFVVEMVDDRADLPNAIALNSAMFNASRIIGPSIGGVMIAVAGEGWCFMVDAISYVAVIVSLLAMRFTSVPRQRAEIHVWQEIADGVRYGWGFPPIRALLLIVSVVSIMGTPYIVLMPAFVSSTLHGGPHTLGILMTASGVGALIGTVYLASRHTVVGLGKVIVAATAGLSLALIAFSFTRSLWIALTVLPIVGAGMMLQSASANTILQTVVEEQMRGRVMAFYSMSVLGAMPIGSLLAGILADRIGAQRTIFVGALVCLAGAGYFAFRRPALAALIRPIYIERGILEPEPDTPLATR